MCKFANEKMCKFFRIEERLTAKLLFDKKELAHLHIGILAHLNFCTFAN
jgi:hypothetical protein